MKTRKFVTFATILPILIGVTVGTVLFMLGDADDSPGLSLLGLVTAFLLTIWGVNTAGVIKKGFLVPILLFCFGAGAILGTVVLLLDGELEQTPGVAILGVAVGVLFIGIGAFILQSRDVKKP